MNLAGLFFVAIGVFTMCGAIFDWEFFIMHRKAWLIRTLFGRTGARIVYAILGAVFVGMGLAVAVGLIKNT
jgi:immunity protein 17 of polymorphic toxin system